MRFDPVDAHYAKAIQRANWEQSVAILEEASQAELQPGIMSYTAAIKRCASEHSTILALLAEMDKKTLELDAVSISSSIWALGSDWVTSLAMLERMIDGNMQLNTITCNAMIRACDQAGQWQRALDVLKLQRAEQIQIDAFTYSSTASACAKGGQWTLGTLLLEEMIKAAESRECEINTICMNAVLSCFEKAQQWSRAILCFEEMPLRRLQPDRTSYNCLMSACNWPTSLQLLEEMTQIHLRRDVVSFNAVMQACARRGEWPRALALLRNMQASTVRASLVSMNTAMSACAVEGKWQETLSLLATSISERLAVDIISLSLTASALLGEGPGTPKASMSWVIEEMVSRRIRLTSSVRSSLLSALPLRRPRAVAFDAFVASSVDGAWRRAVELVDATRKGRRLRRGPLASAAFLRHLVTLASTSACLWLRRVMRSSARGSSCVFRANRAKAKPDVLRQLRAQGWHVVAAPFHADAFHATFDHSTDTATLGVTLPHLTGEVYFQELSSMLPAAVLQAVLPADSLVLDLCAAPGSKSTQLAQFLARGTHGTLVANELDPFRAGKLRANLLRVGLTNFVVTTMDGRAYGDLLPNTFDGVLVDAPCSCEGNARKDIFALLLAGERDWSLEEKQMELALSGWNVLKSGGYLVYSTCTLNRWENEGVCERLVRLGGCERVPVEKVLGMPSVDASGRLWPQELDAEGFFVACFRKTAPVHGVTAPRRAPEPFRLRGAVLLAPEEAQRLEQRAVEVMGFWPGEKETMDGERTLEVVDGCG
ncbi:unnamed protein product [Durusdinium trenchii]|uniref:SAM-dependent MTase RsmB/NOP-type domain-containing protein n=1 Tax=Durusdinium trenchii TaxID=1381693 RepID=A0ABP0PAN2_9DINO